MPAGEAAPPRPQPAMPMKQKVAVGFKSLLESAKKLTIGDDVPHSSGGPPAVDELFCKTDPAVDGEDCLHDCESCTVHYPRGFKIEESDLLYGHINGWSTHVLVATGKSDWVRNVEDEKGSVMQAIGHAAKPSNGKLMLSASNIPTPNHTSDYSEPTTVLLLPAFIIVENVTPKAVPSLITEFVEKAPTTVSPLAPLTLPKAVETVPGEKSGEATSTATTTTTATATATAISQMRRRACPHRALILVCSQRTRDARCGQSAPLLRKELERHLRPLGLYRDLDDTRPGGVGIYFISHVGGHKYSANVMVYRRPDAFGLDAVERGQSGDAAVAPSNGAATKTPEEDDEVGAGQCIWLARVRPEDCENLVKYTVLQGKVVKPERQLRGGFDRAKGLMSW